MLMNLCLFLGCNLCPPDNFPLNNLTGLLTDKQYNLDIQSTGRNYLISTQRNSLILTSLIDCDEMQGVSLIYCDKNIEHTLHLLW